MYVLSMSLKNLIPKHKDDTETAEKLFEYSYEEVRSIIPELLAWIQDMNWPVSRPMADYLVSMSEYLTKDLMKILNGNDEVWKYWCIDVFGLYSDKPLDPTIVAKIKSIAENPTESEIAEEVVEQALRYLKKIAHNTK